MKKIGINAPANMLMTSIGYLIGSLLVLFVFVFAWITLANAGNASVIVPIGDVEASYELYIYQEYFNRGTTNYTLANNECTIEGEYGCFKFVNTYDALYFFGEERMIAPNNRFSFALKITNIGTLDAKLAIEFAGLISEGYDIEQNKVQVAFQYQVKKVVYQTTSGETEDIKDTGTIVHYIDHFGYLDNSSYLLISGVPVSASNQNEKTVIVFFELWFDPFVSGLDENLEPLGSSTPFASQVFTIQRIVVSLVS